MTMHKFAQKTVAENFDRAAGNYDRAATMQAQVATRLVQKAFQRLPELPLSILDIGCGTGLVAEAAARRWPFAQITAMDSSPAMLDEARRKLPHLQTVVGDIATVQLEPSFDLVFSSMALHWMSDPAAALRRWQNGLKPNGRLFAALLIDGSFKEWRDLCAAENVADGLWPLPLAGFMDGIAAESEIRIMTVDYPSARDFLSRLKTTGAATPHPGYKPFGAALMRRLLALAPQPFTITYRVLYIEAPSPKNI